MPKTRVVVTEAQVEAARMIVDHDEAIGRETSEAIRKIAEARHVEAKEMFPGGFFLVTDSFSSIRDPLTGEQMAQYTVVDLNPNARAHETVVNIPVDQKPDTTGWPRYAVVEFDDLLVIPYETEQDVTRGRMEYNLRAERVRLAGQPV